MLDSKSWWGVAFILVLLTVATIVMLLQQPIPQDPSYHLFSDQRSFLNIPNFWNVISNLPFLIVGILGVIQIIKKPIKTNLNSILYLAIFFGAIVIAFGSGYYHLSPSNETLLWDRLPMTITFMALFSVIIGEFVSASLAKRLFIPSIIVGLLSVLYWYWTEKNGQGDLRFYALVQFVPMIIIPIVLLVFKHNHQPSPVGYWLVLCFYVLAKFCEHFDQSIFSLLVVISGHSLKHVAAAVGLFLLLKYYSKR